MSNTDGSTLRSAEYFGGRETGNPEPARVPCGQRQATLRPFACFASWREIRSRLPANLPASREIILFVCFVFFVTFVRNLILQLYSPKERKISHQAHKGHKEHQVAGDQSSYIRYYHLKTALVIAGGRLVSRKGAEYAKIAKTANQPVQRATLFKGFTTMLLPPGWERGFWGRGDRD